jgi:2-isopropylmalate synthase
MPVHDRHPYAGDLVYTAFSGTHQDAIAKGLTALESRALAQGRAASDLDWEVPYLPIDPADVGRSYESVVRVNSQSGKGGVAHVLRSAHGLDLPRPIRVELGRAVQRVSDATGAEIDADRLWEIFADEYLRQGPTVLLDTLDGGAREGAVRVRLAFASAGSVAASGPDTVGALSQALRRAGLGVEIRSLTEQGPDKSRGGRVAVYAEVLLAEGTAYGVGVHEVPDIAKAHAVLSAVNRAQR